MHKKRLLGFLIGVGYLIAASPEQYEKKVQTVTQIPGFVALWDFVKRDPADRRFDAWKSSSETADLRLDVMNYVREYWSEGRQATDADIPVVEGGPFGKAVSFQKETDPTFRPLLLVPRERIHNSGIDIKGPGRSITLMAWIQRDRESGNHAIAGIWHEGTDLKDHGSEAKRVELGKRQYALFSGLAANPHGSAAHISDNGRSSFDDKYARHLSVTPEKIPDHQWALVALVFDNAKDTVTSYLNGEATENWIENPQKHPFFQWAARAWERGEYRPPKKFVRVKDGKLIALKVNPYWFPHDLYQPEKISDGGPFTIGRVIHMGRNPTASAQIGGVAVFNRALKKSEIRKLASLVQ